jgi:D-alanine-D-alanine ligase-like ATP-grasp enzyme
MVLYSYLTNFAEIAGIHFGAIDIIYTAATNKARILEVNTAPGIEGKTVDLYSEVFLSYIASL